MTPHRGLSHPLELRGAVGIVVDTANIVRKTIWLHSRYLVICLAFPLTVIFPSRRRFIYGTPRQPLAGDICFFQTFHPSFPIGSARGYPTILKRRSNNSVDSCFVKLTEVKFSRGWFGTRFFRVVRTSFLLHSYTKWSMAPQKWKKHIFRKIAKGLVSEGNWGQNAKFIEIRKTPTKIPPHSLA